MLSGGLGGMCEEEGTKDPVKEFITTGRTGRRNAMADILNDHANVSTSDLPDRLQALSVGMTILQYFKILLYRK